MEKRIHGSGITTVEQLCQLSPEQMRRIWNNVLGERLWHWLRGADFHSPEFKRKSLGKQHVLPPKYRRVNRRFSWPSSCCTSQPQPAKVEDVGRRHWGGRGVLKKRPARFDGEGVEVPAWKAHMRIHECRTL